MTRGPTLQTTLTQDQSGLTGQNTQIMMRHGKAKRPTTKTWDDTNAKKGEDQWENKWEDKDAEPDKATWGDSAAPADPTAATHTEVDTPGDSSWGEGSNRGTIESDSAAGDDAEEWRDYAKADARPRRPKKYKESTGWGKAKGRKGYDKTKVKDLKSKQW